MRCSPKSCRPAIEDGAWWWWAASARLAAIWRRGLSALLHPFSAGASCGSSICRPDHPHRAQPSYSGVRTLSYAYRKAREARATLKRFGSVIITETEDWDDEAKLDHSHLPPADKRYLGTTLALTIAALAWGFVNFGLLLWIPGELIAEGRDMGLAASIIAKSSFISIPVVAVAALLYAKWSTKGALLVMIGVIALGLLAVVLRQSGLPLASNPVVFLTLLIVGSTGVISILLPYAAENYPLRLPRPRDGMGGRLQQIGGADLPRPQHARRRARDRRCRRCHRCSSAARHGIDLHLRPRNARARSARAGALSGVSWALPSHRTRTIAANTYASDCPHHFGVRFSPV